MEKLISFLKNSPLKISAIEHEAGLYSTKLNYILRGKRGKLSGREVIKLTKVLKKYGFQES